MTPPTLMDDIVFKIVFGTQPNEPILRALVNALLGLSGKERIVELQILSPHGDKEHFHQRGVVLDVKARDGQGRLYNIEVQLSDQPAYIKRSLYYLARLFGEQIELGEPYDQIARTVAISILDYGLFPDQEDLHSTFRFYDAVHGRELSDVLEIHYIELVKFRKEKPHALRTPFEKWLYVLKFGDLYGDGLEALPEPLKEEEGIEMAIDRLRQARASDEVRELIESRNKALHDEATRMAHARREGKQEGKQEGEAEGEARGEARALESVARRLLEQGMDAETILKATGLRAKDLA